MNKFTDDTQAAAIPSRLPFMLGYVVRPFKNGKSASWSRVGVAWAHGDNQGFDLCLDAFPVDGRLVLRAVQEDDPDGAEAIGPAPGEFR
jgi:hypothetical protein